MKWFIASDIHGSAYYCRQMLEAFKREGADRILLLGDILYHGPRNELPEEYDTKAVATMLNEFKEITVSVQGNCDAEVDQWVLEFPILAKNMFLTEGGVSVFATHGHKYREDAPPAQAKGGVLLCGHTHKPECSEHDSFVYVNPGSVSIPKEGAPHSYMIMENGQFIWKDLEGKEFMRYPEAE